MSSNEGIFPLLDRRAPVLERLRDDDDDGDDVGEELGTVIGSAVKSDDEEWEEELSEVLQTSISESLASSFGVDQEDINSEYIKELVDDIASVSETDVLNAEAIERLGLVESDDEESSDDDSDDDKLFE